MTPYTIYKELTRKIADVKYASAVLNWDQETYMPVNGAEMRAQQLSTLSGIAHELATSDELGNLLNTLSFDSSLNELQKRNIKTSLKNFNEDKKYTTAFVKELSKVISETFQAWQKAKETADFKLYAPYLEKLVRLKREECELLGYTDHPYDALLDQYEPETKTADLEILFTDVRQQLVGYIKQLAAKPQNNDSFMFAYFEKDKQWAVGIDLLKQMGFDFDSGRQDLSSHPFTTNFSSKDVRVTTRISENDFHEMIWSCIHEGGHALYEQGLPISEYGLPSGEYISLGIHESQSRLWENNVGRSLSYWKFNYPKLQNIFSDQLKQVTVQDFYKAINVVKPSLIRTSADELTYHTHVLIRFEIEKALIEGSIHVGELPAIWNKKYKDYLGLDVPNDSLGILQDIHWSHGSFGYFPTYSLGSFYAAQFFAQAQKEIPHLGSQIEGGNLKPLLDWLREKIHKHGKYYTAEELCVHLTGEKLNFSFFMNYAKEKYNQLYNL
ncbi:MAG TPA: carboxypeptidase M32 [Bacteroidia bacterium]|nr:carboxypeptidase M32 [Bacteroidia bacterium]